MDAAGVLAAARETGVRFIRLQFIDILGMIKDVAIPALRLDEALNGGIAFDGSALQGFVRAAESEMLLRPDPSTYAPLPWSDPPGSTARLICSVFHQDGRPFPGCPRGNLERVIEAHRGLGYSMRVQTEVEFYLLRNGENEGSAVEADESGGYYDHVRGDDTGDVRRLLVVTLCEMGVPVIMSFHENSPGQHEIVIGSDDALAAADHITTAKVTAKRLAAHLGYQATFMPKPRSGLNGSGLHVRIRMEKSGRELLHHDRKGHPSLRCFLAGVLEHAGALCAVANPIVNSYKRLVPGYEAPTRCGWSYGGRDSLVRVRGEANREDSIEYRGPDPSCNPYLLLACVFQAGLDGLIRKAPLQAPEETAAADGVPATPLPRTLGEALSALETDAVIQSALGQGILPDYINARRVEWQMYLSQVDRWEIDHYLAKC